MKDAISHFIENITLELASGRATEHTYRPAIKKLLQTLDPKISAINEPKQSEHGAPDFAIVAGENNNLKLGYGEAKNISENLDKIEKTEQLDRYKGYANLFLTNNLDWRFFRNGEKIFETKIGELNQEKTEIVKLYIERYEQLAGELANFLSQNPESITNGKRLAEIMGGKARRIRDNIDQILKNKRDDEIHKIFRMMKELLVTDLTENQFADMYAQTLVYGLFVARYSDNSPNDFTRAEARDLVPVTNPFLREFFDHIAGSNFNKSLGYIVDELCEVFSVSDIREIVHRHLKITADDKKDTKDPIIHFYEDFLANYDAALRKKMGAYYTPIPVVRYIIRMVDKVLKEDFGIADGIASNEKIKYTQKTDPYKIGKSKSAKTYYEKSLDIPRVQILDPAVGTATFLNEAIKYIYKKFENQKGLWQSYVNDNILPRLNGFELMMTPYTIAHLKLGMTLSELGAAKLNQRLRVFLTNTLTEGVEADLPIYLALGLAKVVSDEASHAAEVKNNLPVMVVMGNPPYSVSSSNKSKFATELVAPYKKNLNERNIQPLSDDYIKFIAFAEQMISKNGKGVVAMITNNSFIDGIIHRQMRRHLLETFDKIYILDLHGNAKKKKTALDGSRDENVFDIMQGVSIVIAVKTSASEKLADIYHAEIYGKRADKFNSLNTDSVDFRKITYSSPSFLFVQKDEKLQQEYEQHISLRQLMPFGDTGITSSNDSFAVSDSSEVLLKRMNDLISLPEGALREKYDLKTDSRDWKYENARRDVLNGFSENKVKPLLFRPFDIRFIYYTGVTNGVLAWPRPRSSVYFADYANIGIVATRTNRAMSNGYFFITENLTERHILDSAADSTLVYPLYLPNPDGTRDPNFASTELSTFTRNLIVEYSPEDILDYIYAALHSPSYRTKYAEFLKIDFPRVPIPTQKEFDRLVPLGRELRKLHLMKSTPKITTSFNIQGSDTVDKIRRLDEKVYINDIQYFDGVSDVAWNFYIGGYQPAQKWLKDRKSRKLSADDIIHYQNIIVILNETDRIMKEIG